MEKIPKPIVLIVLDGWGYSEAREHNAIAAANTPVWEYLWSSYPHTLINTSGIAVGLPEGQMGNSEVGHMNLGAGRVVYQELTRISRAVETGEFFENPVLTEAVDKAVQNGKAVHVLGLLSPGGVHSHEDHLHAMVELAARRGAERVYVHAILDGRDMPPRSAGPSIGKLEDKLATLGRGRIASLIGRFYGMDRDNRWERVQAAYNLITDGKAAFTAASAAEGLEAAYSRDENDEFVKATAIVPAGEEPVRVEDGDAMVFINFRPDRARQLARTYVDKSFSGFERTRTPELGTFVCMTRYQKSLDAPVAFPPADLSASLGEIVSGLGKRQLRIAETEKYAHVTFFFSCGQEATFPGEDRILVPSPKVETYDLHPEMSAPEVTHRLAEAIESGQYDLIICNYANADMVGHTGIFEAAVKAVETIDESLGVVYEALQKVGGEMLITADHGNVEFMFDEATGQPHTAHTTNPVPLLYVGRPAHLDVDGAPCDLAPSILALMGVTQPKEMAGQSLIHLI